MVYVISFEPRLSGFGGKKRNKNESGVELGHNIYKSGGCYREFGVFATSRTGLGGTKSLFHMESAWATAISCVLACRTRRLGR